MNPSGKAVILARGLATRMRRADPAAALDQAQDAAAAAGLKAMVPVGGRPFLDYVLSALADAGFDAVCLVLGPEHDAVREHYGREARPTRLGVTFATQAQPLGTADAVLAAEAFAAQDSFLVVNADNLYPAGACSALRLLGGSSIAAFRRITLVREGNLKPERVAGFPIVVAGAGGYLERLLEPEEAPARAADPNALVSMNCWSFTPAIFAACRAIAPSRSGELEIQEAVRHAHARLGERFRVLPVASPVLDLTSRADVAEVAARLRGVPVRL